MTTNRTYRRPPHRSRLNHWEEMSLWLGEEDYRPAFESDDERRAAWFQHRDYFMTMQQHPGSRPAAWWDYESPIPRPRDHDYDEAALWEAGLLTEEETTKLLTQWREYFDKAQKPDFQHCIGHAKPTDTFATWIGGARGRALHYRWAGIPRTLVKKWTAQRRRTIRKLQTTAPPQEEAPDAATETAAKA